MDRAAHAQSEPIVVIGYGNWLRSDDSAGRRVAAAVASWGLSGVQVIDVSQLTPELAVPLSAARCAIFVDARLAEVGGESCVRRIEPAVSNWALGHGINPWSLLALTKAAFGSHPRAWLVTVPATNLAVGEGLSPTAESGLAAALRTIALLVQSASEKNEEGGSERVAT